MPDEIPPRSILKKSGTKSKNKKKVSFSSQVESAEEAKKKLDEQYAQFIQNTLAPIVRKEYAEYLKSGRCNLDVSAMQTDEMREKAIERIIKKIEQNEGGHKPRVMQKTEDSLKEDALKLAHNYFAEGINGEIPELSTETALYQKIKQQQQQQQQQLANLENKCSTYISKSINEIKQILKKDFPGFVEQYSDDKFLTKYIAQKMKDYTPGKSLVPGAFLTNGISTAESHPELHKLLAKGHQVNEMKACLKKKGSFQEKISKFNQALEKGKVVLSEHRDRGFLRAIANILQPVLGAVKKSWANALQSRGQKLANELESQSSRPTSAETNKAKPGNSN